MNRMVLGALAALMLAAAGFFWYQGRAELQRGAPLPDLSATGQPEVPITLPSAGAHGQGAALPSAMQSAQSKQDRRFARYDKNKDGRVTRTEVLATRVKAFQKLDTNHDNLLSFEEWAVKTSNRFTEMDANGDGIVTRAEFDAFTAAQDKKKKARAKCACGAPTAEDRSTRGKRRGGGDGGSDGDADGAEGGEPGQ